VATAAIMSGVLIIVITAPKHTEDYTGDEVLELFQAPSFFVFISLTVSFIVGIFLARRGIHKEAGWDSNNITVPWKITVFNLSFGALAGSLGGLNVTLTKTCFSLIVGEFEDNGVVGILSSPVLWCVNVVLVTTYILQMKSNVDGLAQCSAMIVISTHCVSEEVVAILGGVLWFQDYKQFDTVAAICVPLGNVIAVIAVVVLGHLRSEVEMKEKHEEMERRKMELSEPSDISEHEDSPQGEGLDSGIHPSWKPPDVDGVELEISPTCVKLAIEDRSEAQIERSPPSSPSSPALAVIEEDKAAAGEGDDRPGASPVTPGQQLQIDTAGQGDDATSPPTNPPHNNLVAANSFPPAGVVPEQPHSAVPRRLSDHIAASSAPGHRRSLSMGAHQPQNIPRTRNQSAYRASKTPRTPSSPMASASPSLRFSPMVLAICNSPLKPSTWTLGHTDSPMSSRSRSTTDQGYDNLEEEDMQSIPDFESVEFQQEDGKGSEAML